MNLMTFTKTLLLIGILFALNVANAQLVVSNSTVPPYNPVYLIEDVFLGTGVDVLNVAYTGDPTAIGYFNGTNSNIGINEGLIMTTGSANLAVGPNISPSTGAANTGGSDPDLASIAGVAVLNASVYTINFIPYNNTLTFRYVFGSEEYDEFVCSGFNDAFGFFISGPGFNGPYTGGAENIALIPGTTTPVSIDNVNNGSFLCPPSNTAYYINNLLGFTVEYDAFTTVLEATVAVVPCNQYTIKLAIGDAGDANYDSGVFLQANSFGTDAIDVEILTNNNDTTIVEGCSSATVILTLNDPSVTGTSIPLNLGGTAVNGIDYQPIATSVFIPAGQISTSFVINPISDNLIEGTETVTFQVQSSSCAQGTYTILIEDQLPPPFLNCTVSGSSIVFTWQPIAGASSFEVNVNNSGWVSPNGALQHTVTGTPGQTISIEVRGLTAANCTGNSNSISCTIGQSCNLAAAIVDFNQSLCSGVCEGVLGLSITGGTPPLQFLWSNGQITATASGLCPGNTYSVTVVDANGCETIDSDVIPDIPKIQVLADVNDASCNQQDGEILLTVNGGTPGYSYQWNTGDNSATISGLTTGSYTASVTDDNGCCAIVSYVLDMEDCCPATANPCVDAIQGTINICTELGNNPNQPLATIDCDGDGVTNADECTDGTNPLDPCDYEDTSITLPVIADQSGCPVPCPNLTPTTTILPGNIAGNSPIEIAVKVSEIEGIDTDGTTITVRIPSDPRLLFVWNIGLTQAAGVPVQNSDWNYLGNSGLFNTWTYNGPGQIIFGNTTSALGFQAFYDPQGTDGQTTFTATVVPFSGGDCELLNNTDSERLVYFD